MHISRESRALCIPAVALHIRDSLHLYTVIACMHVCMYEGEHTCERAGTKPRMNRLIRNSVPRRARGMFVDHELPERAPEEYDACMRVRCTSSGGCGYKRIAESTPLASPARAWELGEFRWTRPDAPPAAPLPVRGRSAVRASGVHAWPMTQGVWVCKKVLWWITNIPRWENRDMRSYRNNHEGSNYTLSLFGVPRISLFFFNMFACKLQRPGGTFRLFWKITRRISGQ